MAETDKGNSLNFIRDLNRSKEYLEHNYLELNTRYLEYMRCYEFDENGLSAELKKILDSYVFAMSNYLSSYCAVIDHMITIRNELKNRQINERYQLKLDSGKKEEQHFATDLRNYVDHYRLPSVNIGVSFLYAGLPLSGQKPVGFLKDYSPCLEKKELRKWGGWTTKGSRVYLIEIKTYHDRVYLQPLIENLHRSLLEFLEWFKT